jgi:hypothetical protein
MRVEKRWFQACLNERHEECAGGRVVRAFMEADFIRHVCPCPCHEKKDAQIADPRYEREAAA